VALATFFSNALGGCVLLALNYRNLGQTRAAWRIALFGLVVIAALLTLLFLLPDTLATAVGLVSAIVSIISMYQLARWIQGRDYDEHLSRGGESASGWAACGIGLLCALATFGVALGFGFGLDAFSGLGPGQRVVFGTDEEVYYRRGATEAQARAVGRVLQQQRFFDGSGGKTVVVSRATDMYNVSFVLLPGYWDKHDVQDYFEGLGGQISAQAFDGQRIEVRLCDEWMDVKKRILVTGDDVRR